LFCRPDLLERATSESNKKDRNTGNKGAVRSKEPHGETERTKHECVCVLPCNGKKKYKETGKQTNRDRGKARQR